MPERMAKYLEKMRKKGYKLVEIRYSCIFVSKAGNQRRFKICDSDRTL